MCKQKSAHLKSGRIRGKEDHPRIAQQPRSDHDLQLVVRIELWIYLQSTPSWKKDFPGARDDDTVDGRTVHVVPSLVLQGFLGTYITTHIILSFFLVQPTCQLVWLQVPSSLAKSCSIWPWWHAVFFNFFWSRQLVPIVCVLDAAVSFFHSSKVSFPRSNQIVIVPWRDNVSNRWPETCPKCTPNILLKYWSETDQFIICHALSPRQHYVESMTNDDMTGVCSYTYDDWDRYPEEDRACRKAKSNETCVSMEDCQWNASRVPPSSTGRCEFDAERHDFYYQNADSKCRRVNTWEDCVEYCVWIETPAPGDGYCDWGGFLGEKSFKSKIRTFFPFP